MAAEKLLAAPCPVPPGSKSGAYIIEALTLPICTPVTRWKLASVMLGVLPDSVSGGAKRVSAFEVSKSSNGNGGGAITPGADGALNLAMVLPVSFVSSL